MSARRDERSDGEALLQQGAEAYRAGRLDEAVAAFRAATEVAADRSRAWNDLGVALRTAGQPATAVSCYRRSIALDPEGPDAWSNLGNALRALRRYAESEACLRRAIELDPEDADIARNLGLTLLTDGRPEDSLAVLERALARRPEHPDYRFQQACALLKLGRYEEGWVGFERRFDCGRLAPRELDAPLWDGRPLAGETLLVFAEQGLGDMLQFARFLPAAIARTGGRLALECHPPLKRLFAASFPTVSVVAVDEPLPAHDLRAAIASLPQLLRLPAEAIRMPAPYMRPPAELSPPLPPRDGRLRIALTWSGKPEPWDRSCPFERFVELLGVPGVAFCSLQRGEPAQDVVRCGAEALVTDLGSSLADFADDAAVLAAFDLLISVDTSIAHLAGALGRPVWTLLTYESDWRFPACGETCDWYPSMRLFRQPRPDDWETVLGRAREALAALAAGSPGRDAG